MNTKYQPIGVEETIELIRSQYEEIDLPTVESMEEWTRETGITISNDVHRYPDNNKEEWGARHIGTVTWSDGTKLHWDDGEMNGAWVEADGTINWTGHLGYESAQHMFYGIQSLANFNGKEDRRAEMTDAEYEEWEEIRAKADPRPVEV